MNPCEVIKLLREALEAAPIPGRTEPVKLFRERSDMWLGGLYKAALAAAEEYEQCQAGAVVETSTLPTMADDATQLNAGIPLVKSEGQGKTEARGQIEREGVAKPGEVLPNGWIMGQIHGHARGTVWIDATKLNEAATHGWKVDRRVGQAGRSGNLVAVMR